MKKTNQDKRRERNRHVKRSLKGTVKELNDAIAKKDPEKAAKLFSDTSRQLDKAVSKGILPSNRASRKKSRLHRKVQMLHTQP